MKRLFIAIKIPIGISLKNNYSQLQSLLQYDSIRWCDFNNLHLTFKFIGNTMSKDIPGIIEVIKRTNETILPSEITLEGLGVFGSRYSPRVIWCGINNNKTLLQTHKILTDELKTINIFPDRQNFVPHLTLARINTIRNKKDFFKFIEIHKETEFQKYTFKDISLYESIIKPRQKPIYIKLF